jgi:hypothetical protein
MVLMKLVLVFAPVVALVLYGYTVALILAVMSFSTFRWRDFFGFGKKNLAVLLLEEERVVEMLRSKKNVIQDDLVLFVESISGKDKSKTQSFSGRGLARAAALQGERNKQETQREVISLP